MEEMHKFLNMIRSLYNIDADRLPELSPEQWEHFRDDPPRFLIHASDNEAAAIWREVSARQRDR